MDRSIRPPRSLVVVVLLLALAGCQTEPAPPSAPAQEASLEGDALRKEIDDALDYTFHQRRLNLEDHAAWQILHGALAYQRAFPVQTEEGESVSAVDHILSGGYMNGWTTAPGHHFPNDRVGLRAIVESGSKTGQGHHDQWLAILAQCELPAEQPIRLRHGDYTMADFVAQVQHDVPRNALREYSWTLIGLTSYLPTDAAWIASDGNRWSIERLVESETRQELNTSACGGSHRLIGLAMALNRHLAQGGELTGPWQTADNIIQEHIRLARELQNADGSFSTNYFARPGNTADLAAKLGTTGHTLEFLTLAMTDEQLGQPWVTRAAERLTRLFHDTRGVDLECGALYHAAHGLALYRMRRWGEREYTLPDAGADTPVAQSSGS